MMELVRVLETIGVASVRVDGATPGGWAAMRTSNDSAGAEQPGRHDVP